MNCLSTRSPDAAPVSLLAAIARGLAPDGGLYVPATLPSLDVTPLSAAAPLATTAEALLRPYFEGEALAGQLGDLTRAAFAFEAPVRALGGGDHLLELFHGPTAAFKDFGARFLAEVLSRLPGDGRQTTILVATSGDTGAAVAAAFHRRPGFRVVILYPDGRVSARQAHQLGAFGDNVRAFKVRGSFDDCQAMVKAALGDVALQEKVKLGSANSISLGRLLPQAAYYAHASLAHRGRAPLNVVVPTGNLGNAMACLWAREMGFPLGQVVLATNANRGLPDFLASGNWEARASLATLANAMDVGAPSNLERLRFLWKDFGALSGQVSADWVDDATIRQAIVREDQRSGVAVCPHTACGLEVLHRLRQRGEAGEWVVAATAHPAKFETVVEPLLGRTVPPPQALAELLARPSSAEPMEPTAAALTSVLTA